MFKDFIDIISFIHLLVRSVITDLQLLEKYMPFK